MMFDWLMGRFLSVPDTINGVMEFGDEFTRASHVIDHRKLKEKDDAYWTDIQMNSLHGPRSEFFWYENPCTMGDMAIWQGFYLAACCWRGDLVASSVALGGVEKLVRLGGNWRVKRGADLARDLGGEYQVDSNRTYQREGDYEFIDDPSESSLIGIVFGLWVVIKKWPDTEVATRAGLLVRQMADQIIDDGYILRNTDGSPARHGDLRPLKYPWHFGKRAPVRTGALAALLLLAHKATWDERFLTRYRELADAHMNTLTRQETHLMWMHPGYQDLLAYMNYAVLIDMEQFKPQRQTAFRDAMKGLWSRTRRQGNTMYTYLAILSGIDVNSADRINANTILQEFNTNPLAGPTAKDPASVNLTIDQVEAFGMHVKQWGPKFLRGGKWLATQPVPPWSRPPSDIVWQRGVYDIKGGETKHYTGLDFCIAYSLGRSIGEIKGNE